MLVTENHVSYYGRKNIIYMNKYFKNENSIWIDGLKILH